MWSLSIALLAACPHSTPSSDAGVATDDTGDTAQLGDTGDTGPVDTGTGADGLIAHYPLDGDARDASGHAFDGEVSGATATADRNGTEAGAMAFDGAGAHIAVPNRPELASTDVTLAAWVRVDGLGDARSEVISFGTNGHVLGVQPDGTVEGGISGSVRCEFASSTVLTTGTWTHVALTHDDAMAVVLYLDGVAVASDECDRIATAGYGIGIGQDPFTGAGSFHGAIDEVYVYGEALDPSAVQAMAGSR